jgi:FkbM family methyltransferase
MNDTKITTHPILYCKRKICKLRYKRWRPQTGCVNAKMGDINFLFDFSLSRHFGKMYSGLYQFEVKASLKKYLKKGSAFLDIGANVGYITALGADLLGRRGQVHSFEPVPRYFDYLSRVAKMNSDYQIVLNNFALGESAGQTTITIPVFNIGGSSVVQGFVKEEKAEQHITVEVKRLDDYIKEKSLTNISLIKIDVEGFELPVLKGASDFFQANRNCLPPIIVEVTPFAYPLLNTRIEELHEYMSNWGYKAFCILGKHRIDLMKLDRQTDILFKQR